MVRAGNMLGVEDILDILAIPLLELYQMKIYYINKGEPLVYKGESLREAYRNVVLRMTGKRRSIPLI